MTGNFAIKISKVNGMNDIGPIELGTGITTLTGRNNVGKSRILKKIEGIKRILENKIDDSRIEATIGSEDGVESERLELLVDGAIGVINILTSVGEKKVLRLTAKGNGSYTLYNEAGNQTASGIASIEIALMNFANFYKLKENIERIIYIPPYRPISEKAPTQLQTTIFPSGNNLGQVLFYNKNNDTKEMLEIEKVMGLIFPEIEQILTVPVADNLINISIEDKYAGTRVPINEAGTGVAQVLFLVTMIIHSPPGRIFLIDEPHVYLHPQAEKELAKFLRKHNEHSYIIATHSPLLLSQLKPDFSYLVTRDKDGTKISSVFNSSGERDAVFKELGINYGDILLFENIIFVEGRSDELIYDILIRKLGFEDLMRSSVIINISGSGASEQLEDIMKKIDKVLNVPHVTILDGDQKGKRNGDNIIFIPYQDLEYVLLSDPNAILSRINELEKDDGLLGKEWNVELIQSMVNDGTRQGLTGAEILERIYQGINKNLHYKKVTEGPLIAELLDPNKLEHLKEFFENLNLSVIRHIQ
jgi:energy-coupling factor transporter ATP-binding protein EcfA2